MLLDEWLCQMKSSSQLHRDQDGINTSFNHRSLEGYISEQLRQRCRFFCFVIFRSLATATWPVLTSCTSMKVSLTKFRLSDLGRPHRRHGRSYLPSAFSWSLRLWIVARVCNRHLARRHYARLDRLSANSHATRLESRLP